MPKLRHYLRALSPGFWEMNYPYSESWDAALNRLLDKYPFTNITQYHATLGDVSVWVENMPYAAFRPEIEGRGKGVRASRATIARALEAFKRDGGFAVVAPPLCENFDDVGILDMTEEAFRVWFEKLFEQATKKKRKK